MSDIWTNLIGSLSILAVPARIKRVEADLRRFEDRVEPKIDKLMKDVEFIKGRFQERDHQKDAH